MKFVKIFRFVTGLFFILVVWGFFLVGKEFLIKKPLKSLYHVPENANFALRIDATSVLKSTLFSVVLEANDPTVVQAINDQINAKRKKNGASKSLGIDFLSDLVVYTFPFQERQILGMTYNLKKPNLMRKNAIIALESNQVYAINGKIGVVLTLMDSDTIAPNERAKLIEKAKEIAFNPKRSAITEKLSKRESNKFIQLSSEGKLFGPSTLFTQADIDLILKEHKLTFGGELSMNTSEKRTFQQPKYTLNPSGLHFYTTLIPEKIQDTLLLLFSEMDLITPKIEAISFNYRGSTINNTDRNLVYSPNLDLLITFSKPFDFLTALNKSSLFKNLKMKLNGNVFHNGIQSYYFKKINEKTYLFSADKDTKAVNNDVSCLLCLKGDMRYLTNIKGDRMILFFLNNLPIFSTTKNFFSKTAGVDITIKKQKSGKANIKGDFNFKEEYYPMNEFLKLAILNGLIRVK